MKRLVLFLLLVTVSQLDASDFSQKFAYETSYEQAIKKAKLENKTVMFVMVTYYCPWCRKYERDTLSKKSISKLVSSKYVPLLLHREDQKFPKKFDTPRIPTTYFVDAKSEKIIYSEMGYKTKKEFLEMESKVKK